MEINTYKDLIVWQRSMELVESIYRLVRDLPAEERYSLASQLTRSAVSIPSNIAEGYKRRSAGDYRRFLSIADGSSAELETQVLIAERIYAVDASVSKRQIGEVQKMLTVLIRKIGS